MTDRHDRRDGDAAAAGFRQDDLALTGALTAALAHDLRNVLAVVRTAAELAERPERTERELAKIRRSAERGLAVVDRVLAMARGEALPEEEVDLAAAVRDGLEGVRPETGTALRVTVVGGGRARASAALLSSLIAVLIDNSVTAGSSEAQIALSVDGADAIVRVRDNGPGFPPELRERLGVPGVTTGGTGLGLFFARRAAERMGGRIEFANDDTRGALVTLHLPAAPL